MKPEGFVLSSIFKERQISDKVCIVGVQLFVTRSGRGGGIKPVLWLYSCHEEYLGVFDKGKNKRILLAVLQRNRLDLTFENCDSNDG